MVFTITNSVWVELSAAFGAGDTCLARNLHRCACQASLGLSFGGIIFLTLFGNGIYGYWTNHKIAMDHHLFYLLMIEVLVNCLWYTSAVVSIACNRHERQAVLYLTTTALSVPVAYFLMLWFSLAGAGISLILADLCMIGYVLSHSLALLHDNLGEFTRGLFRVPSLRAGNSEAGN
jgi:O-antigen/teichoic acid export membrane protein